VTEDGVGTLRRMPSTTGTMRKLLSEVADIKSVVTGRSRDADAKIKSMVRVWGGRPSRQLRFATWSAWSHTRRGGTAALCGRRRCMRQEVLLEKERALAAERKFVVVSGLMAQAVRRAVPASGALDLLLMRDSTPLLAPRAPRVRSQAIAQDLKQQHQRLLQLHRESEREWRAQLAAIRKAVKDLHAVLPSAQGALCEMPRPMRR